MITPEIIGLPGMAMMQGPGKMREDHWSWPVKPPVVAYGVKTQGGEPAGILRVFLRFLKCETRSLRAVGIGGVWVRPELREQGYATELLTQALAKIRGENTHGDVVILYAEPRTLYAVHGFKEVAEGLLGTSLHGDVTIIDAEWHVEPEGHF